MHLASLLQHLSPDLALLTATAGICFIFLELNRPGLIFPGALGVLLLLLGAARLSPNVFRTSALVALLLATGTLIWNLYRAVPTWVLAASTVGLILGFRFLLTPSPGPSPIHTATALGCGSLLGALAAVLSRIAFRARRAKAVH